MRTPIRSLRRAAIPLLGLAAATLLAAPLARAQAPQTDPRWGAWLGCWAPASAPTGGAKQLQRSPSAGSALLVCVVPAAGSTGVDVATVADTQVVSRERVEATGERRPLEREGCTGWESAQWSAEGARVYVRSELTCQGNLRRRSSGVMALTAEGEWLDVRSVSAGTRSGVRVLRYHAAPLPETLPADVAATLRGAPRGAAGPEPADLTLADVADASRALDPDVVSAWLAETGQDFRMDARRLQEAKRAGIPGSVSDVMVALSYPDVFAINPRSRQAEFRQPAAGEVGTGYGYAHPGYGWGGSYYSPYGWDSWWPYGYGPYSPYYSPYGGYGWAPWYGGYGGWYGGWYYGGGGGVIIVPSGGGGGGYVMNHGRVVKGQGYTQGGGSTSGRSAHPRNPADATGRAAGGRESGASGDRRSGGGSAQPASSPAPRSQPSSSGSSGSSGARTARPRNPGN